MSNDNCQSFPGSDVNVATGANLTLSVVANGSGTFTYQWRKDGANIAIAAKTAAPHPKLAGTVYSACEEIEAAGGKALPCICDIRFEDKLQESIDATV